MLDTVAHYIYRHRNRPSLRVSLWAWLRGTQAPKVEPTEISVVCHGQRIDGLQRLLEEGVRVRYLLTPSPLSVAMPEHPLLECRVFNGSVQTMKTFHFVVAENPDMLWVERSHLPNSFEAEDCEWLPPELAMKDDRPQKLMAHFEKAWACAKPLARTA